MEKIVNRTTYRCRLQDRMGSDVLIDVPNQTNTISVHLQVQVVAKFSLWGYFHSIIAGMMTEMALRPPTAPPPWKAILASEQTCLKRSVTICRSIPKRYDFDRHWSALDIDREVLCIGGCWLERPWRIKKEKKVINGFSSEWVPISHTYRTNFH